MTNKMKKQIADILCRNGYDVVPTLIDETPRYANQNKKMFSLAEKYSEEENVKKLIEVLQSLFPESRVIKKVATDVEHLKLKENIDIDKIPEGSLFENIDIDKKLNGEKLFNNVD
jgi:hypothetical protein